MARRRRTSIRTAAGTAQDRFLERLRELKADPSRVLPETTGEEPPALRRIRRRLERFQDGKPGFLDRRDKGVVGAVANSLPVAELTSVPRLLDLRVEGIRRFFIQRGHVDRAALVGVQNHDDPRALLLAYRALAKKQGLHFFAMPRLWCTGTVPDPPAAWVQALGGKADVTLEAEAPGRYGCGHADRARVVLAFRDGPSLAVCGPCGSRAGDLHKHLTERYAGPRQRQPVEVDVLLPGGSRQSLPPKSVSAYRAGVAGEAQLIDEALATWRGRAEAAPEARFVVGERDLGTDQAAFLDAIGATGWERDALAAMTREGHAGAGTTVAAVAEAHADRLAEGVGALLDEGAEAVLAAHANEPAREVLRKAHEEAGRRTRIADLPRFVGLGPIGAWVDGTARAIRKDGRAAGMDRVRKALDRDTVPRAHQYALLQALGGALDMEVRFRQDEKDAGRAIAALATRLLEAEGPAYKEALAAYLRQSGSGESLP